MNIFGCVFLLLLLRERGIERKKKKTVVKKTQRQVNDVNKARLGPHAHTHKKNALALNVSKAMCKKKKR